MVGLGERARAFVRERGLTTSHRLDHYLTEHLPRLIREHEIATEAQMRPFDDQIGHHHDSVVELESWRSHSVDRMELIKKRIGRLEVKYGLGGR